MFEEYTFTLASASPRRRELLKGLDIDFTVEPGKDEREAFSPELPHTEIPAFLARHKSETFHRELAPKEVLITADTLVFLDEKILGKPHDEEEAVRMLRRLSGKTHQVYTAVTFAERKGSQPSDVSLQTIVDRTDVTFAELSDEEIHYYVNQYQPLDKAGAYGVQEWIGYVACTAMNGSYFNVMGFPTHLVYPVLREKLTAKG